MSFSSDISGWAAGWGERNLLVIDRSLLHTGGVAKDKNRQKKQPKKPKQSSKPTGRDDDAEPRVWTSQKYGAVPLVQHPESGGWTCDPSWQPKLPRGAVRGDPSKQPWYWGTPEYYYTDIHRTCVQCGQDFVFSGEEQKFWYETLQFIPDSTAIRCQRCRRAKRTEKAIRARLANASAAVDDRDARSLLEYAAALVEFIEVTSTGSAAKAIAAARKAARLEKASPEPHYWEGRAQELAHQPDKANACYRRFLETAMAPGVAATVPRRLVADAEERLLPPEQRAERAQTRKRWENKRKKKPKRSKPL